MWFKNIHIYHFETPFTQTSEQLSLALEAHKARRCGDLELSCEGWVKPLGTDGQMYTHESNGNMMLCLRREDKILPTSLLRERLEEGILEFEQKSGRSMSRSEKTDMKDLLIQELLPQAFVKSSQTYAYIDPQNSWLIINASSPKKCDAFIELLRKSLGTLNVVLPKSDHSPESVMTQWLVNPASMPDDFAAEDEVEFRAIGEVTSVIRCKHVDLESNDIQAHLTSGKSVHRLAITWQEKLSFILHDDLSVHRMSYDSELIEQFDAGGDDAAQFDADFCMMAGELQNFIPALFHSMNELDVAVESNVKI
ncbi:MAG: recombination-associated protein RdgC [Mariprofundaceae bacterium]